tara:strand:+ start:262 stop:618 length:357 start_codon:yes stop_codon:yes gene_type:complete
MTSISLPILLAQEGAPAGAPPGLLGNPMVFIVLMFVMMYFVLIRPQRKKQKEQEALIKSIKTGDHVVSIGGIHGIVTSAKEKTVMVKVADNVKIEFDRSAVASISKKTDVIDATEAKN